MNENRNCNGDPCIKVMKEVEEEEEIIEKDDCDLCDLLELDLSVLPSLVTPVNLELDMKLKNIE